MCIDTRCIYTCTYLCHTHLCPQALLTVCQAKKTGFLLTFPSGVSGQAEEHLHQWGLKWLPGKCKGSSLSHKALTGVTWLFDCKYGFLISLIVKCNGHSRGERGLQAMLPIYKMLLQTRFTVLVSEDVYGALRVNNARFDLLSEYFHVKNFGSDRVSFERWFL